MHILHIISSVLSIVINIILFFLLYSYRRMLLKQQERFMTMYRLVDRYRERYELLKEDKKNIPNDKN